MQMSASPKVQNKLDELRPRFLDMVAERFDRFLELRDQLPDADDTKALLDEIRSGAHRMAGLAATLGFNTLGSLAISADLAIGRLRSEMCDPQPTDDLLYTIDMLLLEMGRLLSQPKMSQ